MIIHLKQWLAPPIFEGEDDKTRSAQLLNVSLLGIILVPALVVVLNLFERKIPIFTIILDVVSIALGFYLRHLLYKGHVKFVGKFIVGSGFIVLTIANASLGTIRTPTTTIYLFLIVMAGVLFGKTGIIFSTATSSLAVLGLILAENAGLLPAPNYAVTIIQWGTYTAIFAVIGSMSFAGYRTMQQALMRARQELEERKNTEKKLQRQNEYLANLHQITLDLLSRQPTQTLLNNIVQYAMLLVDAHHGYIFLPDGNSLVLSAATQGFVHNIGKREPKPGKGVLGRVWKSKEIFIVENYNEWELRDINYAHENLHTVAGIPVKIGDNIIGVLELVSNTPRIFTPDELKLLTRFALLTALVLDNARLLDSAKNEITERKRKETVLKNQVIEIEKLQSELHEQALHDPLTKLYNRRHLSEMLERELNRTRREKKSISVILMDIDRFKKVNDMYGHQVGDKFLEAFAKLLKSQTRGSDIACRYGGEEFLLVLPGATTRSALKRAEQIRQSCSKIYIPYKDQQLSITISMGIATCPAHAHSADDLLTKADNALYRSKRNGRNQVTSWSETSRRKNLPRRQ